ncbi:MAG: DNA-directed RNA polymerase subunit omega [Actinomycetota bacterium]|nr:DNA-directed RNA polymerase subunit omega [Actinomycetota bacterium]MDA8398312.1 DNA-directed RNA polymerase subunit omega [Actinomycetota bacterium]
MSPPIEELLDKVDSKYSLVTLGARRARQINAYLSHLGHNFGSIVPPQIESVSKKPLSVAFEEIAQGMVEPRIADEAEEELAEGEAEFDIEAELDLDGAELGGDLDLEGDLPKD